MAPVELTIKASSSDTFKAELDDEEDVESLSVIIMSLRPELGEELRLLHKGKFLKDEQKIKDLALTATSFIAVVAKKKPEAQGYVAPAAAAPAPTAQDAAMYDDEEADLAAALAMSQQSMAAAMAPDAGGTHMECDGDVCRTVPNAAAPAAAAAPAPAVVPSGQVGSDPNEAMVTQLLGMGFERAQVLQALRAAFGNPDRAVEYLFNGIPAVEQDAPPDAAPPATTPGAPQPGGAIGFLGPQMLTKAGMKPTAEALQGVDVVMLYFSAHWCPPCRAFTPQLATAFTYGTPPPNLACVFVSGDRDEASFTQYYNEMPWMAMPYSNPQRQSLGGVFGVRGIPSLVIVNAKTGATISANGREDISRCGFNLAACMQTWGMAAAPAAAKPVSAVTSGATTVLGAAAEKKAEPDPGPPPLPIDDAAANAALQRVQTEEWEVQDAFFKTGLKVLNNILANPGEEKFRTLKRTNAALKSKLLGVAENAGTELVVLAGFEATSEEALTMSAAPDGRCSAVRNHLKAALVKAWENQQRKERDDRIATEMAKDKANKPRSYGTDNDNGRNTYGADRRRGGGGGGGG